jgi:hypothetical protein
VRSPRTTFLAAVATAAVSLGVLATGTASAAGATGASPTASAAAGKTLFGVSLPAQPGLSATQTVGGFRTQFGALPAVRIFGDQVPAHWNDSATLRALGTGSAVIFSFQGDMDAIAAGADDARLTSFLQSKPAGVKVWVALKHEPEDQVRDGVFTAAQFRAATAHVAPVIRRAGGIPTTILMAWTLDPHSGRNWHDFYTPAIDAFGFDAYNSGQHKKVPDYKAPQAFVDPVLAVARETGKSFGWAELGSPCVSTDPTCVGRAAWLTALGTTLAANGAQFATYWNRASETSMLDFSLKDRPSINAWKALSTR